MPRLKLCPSCGEALALEAECNCAGAKAKRQRANNRAHRRQKTSGRTSAHWRRLRKLAIARDMGCVRCPATVDLTVDLLGGGDHRTATLEQVETLCRSCHGRRDGGRRS